MAGIFGLPLLASMLFAFASLLIKRTAVWQVDIWRVSFLCNITTALIFQPLWLLSQKTPAWPLWWQPLTVAVLYGVGQVFTLTSLARGEISVAAPVLGLKIVFVPIFLWLLGAELLPAGTWLACTAATIGVIMLNSAGSVSSRGRVLFSVATALVGAAAFAMFDVCVQLWSPAWGREAFLSAMFGMATVISLGFIPLFKAPLRATPKAAWPTLSGGAALFGLQALALISSVAYFEHVAVTNVVYSSRGLWSLALVWLIGARLQAADLDLTPRVVVTRACGAGLLLGAILLLLT